MDNSTYVELKNSKKKHLRIKVNITDKNIVMQTVEVRTA